MTKSSKRVVDRKRQKRSGGGDRWGLIIIGGGVVIAVILSIILLTPQPIPTLDGMITYSNLSRDHTDGTVNYPQSPPVGGPHNPVWQNCGVYDQPVRNENAVHSLEHGAVWITYQPDLPTEAVAKLRALAKGHDHVLVSPYPSLTKPIVATAWGLQLGLDDVNDSRLPLFISRYEQGPQTPELGADCSRGIGTPLAN
jgi:hypothetical protein